MIAAFFALAGTLVGVMGTLAIELVRVRTGDIRARREVLRLACANFTSAVARTRNIAMELTDHPKDSIRLEAIHEANREVRENFELLRLVATSYDVQKAARYVTRYAFGLVRQAEGKPPRDDETDPSLLLILHDWLMKLRIAVRHEIGIPDPDSMYYPPKEWIKSPDGSAS
jgi:hypothetical protein